MARRLILFSYLVFVAIPAGASVFGSARGVVHDSQHHPIQSATVTLRARTSDWSSVAQTDASGQFLFLALPPGDYSITAVAPGFASLTQNIAVNSASEPVLHFQLLTAGANMVIDVDGSPSVLATDSATPITTVTRAQIEDTPGAARTNSLAMITDFVPGSYITHDQLHIRGGHQASWLIDGVPIPNTNIASNLGPQLDPKDIDYLETSRGSYGAELGDRTYGVFNVVPRTGFERNREAELVLSAGNFYQTNDAFSLGSHTERFAYYASANGNRSDLGIQTPVPQVVHDRTNGFGGFGSLIFNRDPANQFRFVTSLRRDYYQIPYDPNAADLESSQYPTIGLRDVDRESDAFIDLSWVHIFNPSVLLTTSPFYHYNRANYDGAPEDTPVSTRQHRGSIYAGAQIALDARLPRNNLQIGTYGFYQSDSELFGAIFNDGSSTPSFTDHEQPTGHLAAFFVDDKITLVPGFVLSLGARPTHFSGGVTESAISPRLGLAFTVPHLHTTLRAFYGHYYQAPPLVTASGPLVQFATSSSLGFIPLHGERDEEFQFGLTIPYRGWVLDADTFRTRASNFFDHNNIGESNLFFPITISQALIRAWELTLRSPRIGRHAELHLAYSNQIAEGGGTITGGLTDFSLPVGLSPLDHDQRNTLNVGGDLFLPWKLRASTNVYYGSGFTNGAPGAPYPGAYLPAHTTFDLSLSHAISDRCSFSVTALNVANRRVELDNSITFGGFHWNSPREIYAELRYRFNY
jgi:hypothetical protein